MTDSAMANAFVGGDAGAFVALTDACLIPGDRGYTAAMLEELEALLPAMYGMYESVLLEAVAPPEEDQDLVAAFNGFVPQANAFYRHLARLDAMQSILGITDLARQNEQMGPALDSAGELPRGDALAAAVTDATRTFAVTLGAYSDYQQRLVATPAAADVRDHARTAHKLMAALVDLPSAQVTPPVSPAVSELGGHMEAALSAIDDELARRGDGDVVREGIAVLRAALARHLAAASRVSTELDTLRAAYWARGSELDQGADVERYTTLLILAGQVREALAVGRGALQALPGPNELSVEQVQSGVASFTRALRTSEATFASCA